MILAFGIFLEETTREVLFWNITVVASPFLFVLIDKQIILNDLTFYKPS